MRTITITSVTPSGQDVVGNPINTIVFANEGKTFSFSITTLKVFFENLKDKEAYFLECANQEFFLSNL